MTLTKVLENIKSGAGNGSRTRDPQLGKLMLYQLSYARRRITNVEL